MKSGLAMLLQLLISLLLISCLGLIVRYVHSRRKNQPDIRNTVENLFAIKKENELPAEFLSFCARYRLLPFSSKRKHILHALNEQSANVWLKINFVPIPDFVLPEEVSEETYRGRVYEMSLLSHVGLLKKLKEPCFLPLIDLFLWPQQFSTIVVFPLVDSLSEEEMSLHPERVKNVFRQLLLALQVLHSHQFIHMDVKPSNMLVDRKTEHLYLIDFDNALPFGPHNPYPRGLGTHRYQSPESTYNHDCTFASDVWSAGVTLAELLLGRPPFEGDEKILAYEGHIDENKDEWIVPKHNRSEFLTPAAETLIKSMLKINVEARITIEQALALEYLST